MSEGISASLLVAVLLLLTGITFSFLLDTWSDQTFASAQAMQRQKDRLESKVEISSADTGSLDCKTYTVTVVNSGRVAISDFTEMDLLAEYTEVSGNKATHRLAYGAGWSVASISPDTRDPNT